MVALDAVAVVVADDAVTVAASGAAAVGAAIAVVAVAVTAADRLHCGRGNSAPQQQLSLCQ